MLARPVLAPWSLARVPSCADEIDWFHGRELRVEGTFASWYTPGSHVTRSVWDAIAAPVLALPPRRRRSSPAAA